MIQCTPSELTDSPILITTSDPGVRSPEDTQPLITMQRAIKAHCILGGSVTMPSEHIISDEITSQAVLGMPGLLRAGVLVPDLRADFPTFGDFVVRDTIRSSRSLERRTETAAFLDATTKRAILYTPSELSKVYARNLLRSLLLTKVQDQVQITWPALRQLSEEWLNVSELGTAELDACRKSITRGQAVFDQNATLLYHIIGGASTGGSPLLPESLDSALRALLESLNRNESAPEKLSASVGANDRTDLMKVLEAISPDDGAIPIQRSSDAATQAAVGQFALLELLDAFSIHSGILDRLDDAAVVEIAQSAEAKRARKTIEDAYREVSEKPTENQVLKLSTSDSAAVKADFRKKIHEVIRIESTRTRRVSKVNTSIGWGGVALGIATLPFTGAAGFAVSLGGVLLSVGGSSLDSWNQLYSKPMLTLLEKIQSGGEH